MAQTVTYDPLGTPLVLSTRRPDDTELAESAYFGEADHGKIVLDDDTAAIVVAGQKQVDVVESSAPAGNRRLYTGTVGQHFYRRSKQYGTVGPDAREIEIELIEINTILGDHKVRGKAWNRKREKAATRLAALLASGFLDCEDRGRVVYPEIWMDANDYRGQFAGNVLADIGTVTGFDWTLLLDDEGETVPELFFDDFDRSTEYSSAAVIDNSADDNGSTTFAPIDPGPNEELERDPGNIGSGGFGAYSKGSDYRTRAATAAAHRSRDIDVTTSQAKTKTQADRIIDKYLAAHADEDDTVRLAILTPPASVNKIRRGHRVFVTLTYAPGLESGAWCRVKSRKVSQPAGHDLKYRLDLLLKPMADVCTNPTEILEAHATVTAGVVLQGGTTVWAHASIPNWFGGPDDDPVTAIPINNPTAANDGDPLTYSGMDQQMVRNAGTPAARWEAELDGTYEICRIRGTVEVGSNSWRSFPPSRIEYWDIDLGAWATVPGSYILAPSTPSPRYWTLAVDGIQTTKLALVYEQTGVPGILGLWGFWPLGVRVYDWLAYGTAV